MGNVASEPTLRQIGSLSRRQLTRIPPAALIMLAASTTLLHRRPPFFVADRCLHHGWLV
jgi:hypothetical protein